MARILLCNDDGYRALGITVLGKVLRAKGHDVFIVAPHEERSGQSHAMSFFSPVLVRQEDEQVWSVRGTPADCAAIALQDLLVGREPDLVISGINHGYNVGWDVHYSGTVGAATEAAFLGYRAIAASMYTGVPDLERAFEHAALMTDAIAGQALEMDWPQKAILNFNHPGVSPCRIIASEYLGDSLYEPGIEKFVLEGGGTDKSHAIYILGGSTFRGLQQDSQDDVSLVTQECASLTLLNLRQEVKNSAEFLRKTCAKLNDPQGQQNAGT